MYLQVPPGWGGIGQVGMAVAPVAGFSQSSSQVPEDTDTRVPVINLKDGTRLAGDDAPKRKDIEQWLAEHPGFVADTGAFIPVSPFYVYITYNVTGKFTKKRLFVDIFCQRDSFFRFMCRV